MKLDWQRFDDRCQANKAVILWARKGTEFGLRQVTNGVPLEVNTHSDAVVCLNISVAGGPSSQFFFGLFQM